MVSSNGLDGKKSVSKAPKFKALTGAVIRPVRAEDGIIDAMQKRCMQQLQKQCKSSGNPTAKFTGTEYVRPCESGPISESKDRFYDDDLARRLA